MSKRSEQYGPALIETSEDGQKVIWSFDNGGTLVTGEVAVESNHEAALYRARRAVDSALASAQAGVPTGSSDSETLSKTEPATAEKEPVATE